MIRKFAAAIVVSFLIATPASAAPMKCSGEQKTCLTVCLKMAAALQTQCIAACHASLNYCRQTGCWTTGASRYCGLLRQ